MYIARLKLGEPFNFHSGLRRSGRVKMLITLENPSKTCQDGTSLVGYRSIDPHIEKYIKFAEI